MAKLSEHKKPWTLLEWAKRSTIRCPNCDEAGIKGVPNSWVTYTCWCPACERIWRWRRNKWSWKGYFYYVSNEGRPIPTERRKDGNTSPS